MASACKVVGNFNTDSGLILPSGCFISVNNNINTEVDNFFCSTPLGGATIGTLNISAYTDAIEVSNRQQRAGVTIPWQRKYDCENDTVHFIFVGQGRSYNVEADDVILNQTLSGGNTQLLSVSSNAGPSAVYFNVEQEEGFGMLYNGGPINFDTTTEVGCRFSNMGFGKGDYYLQNFYLEAAIGALPVVTYTFVYQA